MVAYTISKKISEIRVFVSQAVRDVLDDPDFKLELSDEAKKRLRRASATATGKKNTSPAEIKRKYF